MIELTNHNGVPLLVNAERIAAVIVVEGWTHVVLSIALTYRVKQSYQEVFDAVLASGPSIVRLHIEEGIA